MQVGLHLNVSEGYPLSDPETVPTLVGLNPSGSGGVDSSARRYTFLGMNTLKKRFDAGTVDPSQVCSGTRWNCLLACWIETSCFGCLPACWRARIPVMRVCLLAEIINVDDAVGPGSIGAT